MKKKVDYEQKYNLLRNYIIVLVLAIVGFIATGIRVALKFDSNTGFIVGVMVYLFVFLMFKEAIGFKSS